MDNLNLFWSIITVASAGLLGAVIGATVRPLSLTTYFRGGNERVLGGYRHYNSS